MAIEGFLNNLNKEIGYKFGNPWRYSDKSLGVVVPILKQDGTDEERIYITLEEARDQGIKFKDSGQIDRIIIESPLRKPIFVRSGTILKSTGTQSRAVESSIIIIPQEEKDKDNIKIEEIPVTRQEIFVRCIYASKPIRNDIGFEYGGYVTSEVGSVLMSKGTQGATWNAVGNSTHRLMADRRFGTGLANSIRSRSMRLDDLSGIMDEMDKFTDDVDKILAKIPLFENQVGAIFLDIKEVIGLEMFDHPKSWESIHKEVEKRLGESLAKEEDDTFFKPDYERIKPLTLEFLNKLLESEKKEVSHGNTSTITLKGKGIVGEATTINGKVIHLIGMVEDKKNKLENNSEMMMRGMLRSRMGMQNRF